MPQRSRSVIHEHLQAILADLIAEDMKAWQRHGDTPLMPAALIGGHVASTFVLVLNWWLDCEPSLKPEQVDARFRQFVVAMLATL